MWLPAYVPADWLSGCVTGAGTQPHFCQFVGRGFVHRVEEVSPRACDSVHICAQGSAGCTLVHEALLPQLCLCWAGLPSTGCA